MLQWEDSPGAPLVPTTLSYRLPIPTSVAESMTRINNPPMQPYFRQDGMRIAHHHLCQCLYAPCRLTVAESYNHTAVYSNDCSEILSLESFQDLTLGVQSVEIWTCLNRALESIKAFSNFQSVSIRIEKPTSSSPCPSNPLDLHEF